MVTMTPRERVMSFFRHQEPDRVPWVEVGVDEALQVALMGTRAFTPRELCRKLGMDAFGYYYPASLAPGSGRLPTLAEAVEEYYHPRRVTFDFVPPWIARMEADPETGRLYVGRGLLTSREALHLFDEYLPDPDHPARYEQVARWLDQYREEFAVFARVRLGAQNCLESMGLDVFGYALYDDPHLVREVLGRFSEWTARVVRHLNEMDFDFIWVTDDLACNSGPFMSPRAFREFFLPPMSAAASEIRKPWILHSDGNLFPLLDDLLPLGMSGIHPIQPSAMDISRMKREYGDRVGLVGNIDLDYTLTRGTPEEVDAEVRQRIAVAGPGGGYMVSSANSLTSYCKPENVWTMARAIRKYGQYPLESREVRE